jgi:hypothetical protein
LLTGQWKCGKTTLLAALLSRLGAGGDFAGQALAAGKAVVVSEESPTHWQQRGEKFGFGPHLAWLCRPFRGKPTADEWLALIDHLSGLRVDHGVDLVVVDPLASFLPGHGENNAGSMLDCLLPLQRLTTRGMAVLLLHHPRKKEAPAGRLARGSGALSGYVDILLEMDWFASPTEPDRRRRLQAFSRHAETPRQVVIERNEAGTDFRSLGTVAEVEFGDRWRLLRRLLEPATEKMTRRALWDAWPTSEPPVDETTLWRWLEQAAEAGLLCRDGTGRRNDPYRFWLPEKGFAEDPLAFMRRQERADAEVLRRLERGEW